MIYLLHGALPRESLWLRESFELEGLTQMVGTGHEKYLHHLSMSLENLTFKSGFNPNLEGVTFPKSLQSLTFGEQFNQSLKGVTFQVVFKS